MHCIGSDTDADTPAALLGVGFGGDPDITGASFNARF